LQELWTILKGSGRKSLDPKQQGERVAHRRIIINDENQCVWWRGLEHLSHPSSSVAASLHYN
jgi:hypothetical protein